MIKRLVKSALVTLTVAVSAVASITPAKALPNLPYQQEDLFSATTNLNVRLAPCSSTAVGSAKKGLTAYYIGNVSPIKTCFGRTSKFRNVVFVSENPDGGTDSIEGWVADYLLDNVQEVQKSQQNGTYVRVNLNSSTLSLRKGSLTGQVLKNLPNKAELYVLDYSSPVVIGSVKRYPTKVLYIDAKGKKTVGFVDATYLVAYNVYD